MVKFTCTATNQGRREVYVDERRDESRTDWEMDERIPGYFHTNVESKAPEFWMIDMDECGWILWTEVRRGKGETGRKDEHQWMKSSVSPVVSSTEEGYGASSGGELQSQPEE